MTDKQAEAEGSRRRSKNFLIALGIALAAVALVSFLSLQADRTQAQTESGPLASLRANPPGTATMLMPELTLMTVDGRELDLTELKGKAVLVNFWATWCPPCRLEMPDLEAFYQQNQADGVVVIAINAGEPAGMVDSYVDELGLSFDVLLDPTMQSMHAFRVASLPTSFFVDRDGVVRTRFAGALTLQQMEQRMASFR